MSRGCPNKIQTWNAANMTDWSSLRDCWFLAFSEEPVSEIRSINDLDKLYKSKNKQASSFTRVYKKKDTLFKNHGKFLKIQQVYF